MASISLPSSSASDGDMTPLSSVIGSEEFPVGRVLVLYTGGTIGMKNSTSGYIPEANYLQGFLSQMRQFHDPDSGFPLLTTPVSCYGKRVHYKIVEYEHLLDSSNMSMDDWVRIAEDIEKYYEAWDAFVVLHGTDTMAYTAAALSFMLENLRKTVIFTGSQVPLSEMRSDAIDNFLGALTIAGHFTIPEVCLYFNHTLFRGNRATKVNAVGFDAFDTPNCRPLVKVGINIDVEWDEIIWPDAVSNLHVHKQLNSNVGTLRIFLGITEATVKAFLQPPMQGVVLETFGSGNAPDNRPDILQALREACERGVVIVNCSQCLKGLVSDIYATGKALTKCGVVPGHDMTNEAALTKLSYLLGKGYSVDQIRQLMKQSLKGELTVSQASQRFSFDDKTFLRAVAKALKTESRRDMKMIARAINPVLLCAAAHHGEIDAFKMVMGDGGSVNGQDYDGRTPLHLAAAERRLEVAEFLIRSGANLHAKDRWGRTPLYEAVTNQADAVAAMLRKAGASLMPDSQDLVHSMCRAASMGDVATLKRLHENGCLLDVSNYDRRTPLHVAVADNRPNVVEYLLSLPGLDHNQSDRWGRTPLEEAQELGYTGMAEMISTALKQAQMPGLECYPMVRRPSRNSLSN